MALRLSCSPALLRAASSQHHGLRLTAACCHGQLGGTRAPGWEGGDLSMLAHRMGKRCAAEDERRARSALCLPSWGDETHWIPRIPTDRPVGVLSPQAGERPGPAGPSPLTQLWHSWEIKTKWFDPHMTYPVLLISISLQGLWVGGDWHLLFSSLSLPLPVLPSSRLQESRWQLLPAELAMGRVCLVCRTRL